MGKFVKGDIVVLNFPFSDLSGAKRRPAFVLAKLEGPESILCQGEVLCSAAIL
jgi:mRNA interferase MazF